MSSGDTGRVSIGRSSMNAASGAWSSGIVELDAGESRGGKSKMDDAGVAGTGERRLVGGRARFAIDSVSEGDVLVDAMAECDVLSRESWSGESVWLVIGMKRNEQIGAQSAPPI